jgi:hypothetical protein
MNMIKVRCFLAMLFLIFLSNNTKISHFTKTFKYSIFDLDLSLEIDFV